MKLKHLLPAIAIALPLLASARPVKPGIITVKNPDGTTVGIQHRGDEHFAYTVDDKGEYLLERDAKGNWSRAIRNGIQLKADAVGLTTLRSEFILKDEKADMKAGPMRMADIDEQGRSKFPCKGKVKSPVVLVEYSDCPFTLPNPHQLFYDLCNKEGYSDYGANGSARDYYKASSDGIFDVEFDVYGPIKIPYTQAYISGDEQYPGQGKYLNFDLLIQNSLQQLDAQGVDFSVYDYDNDGVIDNIYFFYAGFGQADHFGPGGEMLTNLVWPHQSVYHSYMMLDGKRVGPYACSNELKGTCTINNPVPDGIGAFCHEFGHVLGLPDLYDAAGGNTEVPGEWTVMCSGSYNMESTCPPLFSTYERWVCGWTEYNDMTEGSSYSLSPLSTKPTPEQIGKPDFRSARLRIPTYNYGTSGYDGKFYPNEYYIFENRTREGYDKSLAGEGMLIWRINFDRSTWRNNRVNSNNDPHVQLVKAPSGSILWPDGFSDIDYLTAEHNPLFHKVPSPNWTYWITDMKYDADSDLLSFNYNTITEAPKLVTEFSQPPYRINETQRTFMLTWKPVEEAKSYKLTLYYENNNGTRTYVNGLEDWDLGNVTQAQVSGLTSSTWKKELHAYVRVIGKLPSTEVSQELVFIPENLEIGSGVDEITGNNDLITGGTGCIYAPEGAEVYSLSGIRLDKDNLAKGMYIVRYAGRSTKVVVR